MMEIGRAMDKIEMNSETSDTISFLAFERFNIPREMKKDYQWPVLHDFLPF